MTASPTRIRDTSAQDQVLSSRKPHGRGITLAIGAAVLVVAAIAWLVSGWMGGSRSIDSKRLRIAEVQRGDLVRDLSADGRVIAANSPTLYAIAAGTVALKVVAGDKVTKGQELAVIDSPELRSKLAQEQATLAGMQAEASRAGLDAQLAHADANKALQQAQIEQTAAARDVQRYQRAYDAGALAQVELAKAHDELKKTEIGLANAGKDARLRGAGANLDARNKQQLAQRQQAVVEEMQRQVDALTLRAPFDGQVGQIQVPQGTSVVANGAVMSVVDLSKFEVEIKVPESFARDLGIGMPAQISSANQPYPAEVSAVSPEVVNGEVNARVRFAEGKQPAGLRQNQRLSARIVLDTRRNVLKVERGPFLEQEGGTVAYLMDGNSAVRRPVQTGTSSLSEVELLSGVQPGDRIVVSGTDLFNSADKVRISGE